MATIFSQRKTAKRFAQVGQRRSLDSARNKQRYLLVFENPCPNGQPASGPSGRPQMCNPRNAHSGSSCPATFWCHGGANAETTVCCPGSKRCPYLAGSTTTDSWLFTEQDPCQLPMSVGHGNYALPRFYFDHTERLCKPFTYRGAKGNSNNFMSPDECMTVCPVFIDPCPASNATVTSGRRQPPAIVYCSAAVAAAVSSIHHHRHKQPTVQDQRIGVSSTCPPNHWCHIGADSKTTICCPNGNNLQLVAFQTRSLKRFCEFQPAPNLASSLRIVAPAPCPYLDTTSTPTRNSVISLVTAA